MKKVLDIDIDYCFFTKIPDIFQDTEIIRHFDCSYNQLTSLVGAPEYVGWSFYCANNQLTSLVGAPKHVGSDFFCASNAVQFTEEQVRAVCNVKGGVYV